VVAVFAETVVADEPVLESKLDCAEVAFPSIAIPKTEVGGRSQRPRTKRAKAQQRENRAIPHITA